MLFELYAIKQWFLLCTRQLATPLTPAGILSHFFANQHEQTSQGQIWWNGTLPCMWKMTCYFPCNNQTQWEAVWKPRAHPELWSVALPACRRRISSWLLEIILSLLVKSSQASDPLKIGRNTCQFWSSMTLLEEKFMFLDTLCTLLCFLLIIYWFHSVSSCLFTSPGWLGGETLQNYVKQDLRADIQVQDREQKGINKAMTNSLPEYA